MPASLAITCEAPLSIGSPWPKTARWNVSPASFFILWCAWAMSAVGTTELVADVAHGVAEDEQRPRRIEYAYMTRCVTGRGDHAEAEHFVVVIDRLRRPRRFDLRDIRGARVRRRLGDRPEYFADAANVIGMIVRQDHVLNRIPT